jgi:hypothetical protein
MPIQLYSVTHHYPATGQWTFSGTGNLVRSEEETAQCIHKLELSPYNIREVD